MGSRDQALPRRIQRICQVTCDARGGVISFTPITVHRAEVPTGQGVSTELKNDHV